jgi:hypothetical protein
MRQSRNYIEFLSPNLHLVYNNVYEYCKYIDSNIFTINVLKRYKIRKYRKILNKWIDDIDNVKITDILLYGFFSFISINQDVFVKPAFVYKDLEKEDILTIKVREVHYKDYDLPEWMKGENVEIRINRRTNSIMVKGLVRNSYYKHEFKDRAIYPDNPLNRDIYNMVRSIIKVCTAAFIRGDQDAIERMFRTKPIQ